MLFLLHFADLGKFDHVNWPRVHHKFICLEQGKQKLEGVLLMHYNPPKSLIIVGKGVHTSPPLSKISPFLEIQDVPTFYRPIRKTKVLNDSFNQFVYKFYPQSILTLEKYLLKWGECKCFLVNFMKNGCQLEKEI